MNDNLINCTICLEEIKNKKELKCGHVYCKSCINKWFETNNICPICREVITPRDIDVDDKTCKCVCNFSMFITSICLLYYYYLYPS